jgi:hypothetical protein
MDRFTKCQAIERQGFSHIARRLVTGMSIWWRMDAEIKRMAR